MIIRQSVNLFSKAQMTQTLLHCALRSLLHSLGLHHSLENHST